MYTFVVLFVGGLIIGSFLNVLALRYKPEQALLDVQQIGGRSMCMTCKKSLKWYELVPLFSFIVQGAKCRHCRHAISWQYPVVEFLTGFLTASVSIFFYNYYNIQQVLVTGSPVWPFYAFIGAWLLVTYAFIVTSIIDIRYTILPDQITIFIAIFAALTVILKASFPAIFMYGGSFAGPYSTALGHFANPLMSSLVAAIIGFGLFALIITATKGRGMGMGDLKIAIPIGLLVGYPDVLLSLGFAFIVGSLFAISLLFFGLKKMKDGVPFGPFLAVGMYLALFYGETFLRWYFSLI
jgi:leader peptidase (prepilin peptidase)/N-methyltransferase